jgi:hypothetical protein
MGAIELLRGPGRGRWRAASPMRPLLPLDPGVRTAIIMPICNEHVPTVFGGLAATIDSLRATGESAAFDVFVLSDTNDPDIRAAEQAAWSDLAGRLAAEAGGDPQRCACTTAGGSAAPSARPATSPTSAAAGARPIATSSSSTPTAS